MEDHVPVPVNDSSPPVPVTGVDNPPVPIWLTDLIVCTTGGCFFSGSDFGDVGNVT